MSLSRFRQTKRLIIKIGSHVLTDAEGVRVAFLTDLAKQVAFLQRQGVEVVLVSSGAIATALSVLKKSHKPQDMAEKQAFAAYGQPLLMQQYIKAFAKQKLQVAQVLLTHSDLKHRQCLGNAKQALTHLLKMQIVPIINENDTVAVEEIRFGDNDRLSAFVAKMLHADFLVIFSHVAGFYDANPQKFAAAKLIRCVERIDKKIKQLIFADVSSKGTGGMATKVAAAQYCTAIGIPTLVTTGFKKQSLVQLWQTGQIEGTCFLAQKTKRS